MRVCDDCGMKMPRFRPRNKTGEGKYVCDGCHPDMPGNPGVPTPGFHGSKVAHDSGDGETIYHCPFCGGGQVVAGSDGSVECGFCKTHFTVQVQPEYASMPQTINGVPQHIPGMPGEVGGQPPGQGPDPGVPPAPTAPATDTGTDAFAFAPPPAATPAVAAALASTFTVVNDTNGWREVDPTTLKPGDRVFVPAMGTVMRSDSEGRVEFIGGVQVQGTVWTVKSTARTLNGQDEIEATSENGETKKFPVPPGRKLIKMTARKLYLNAEGVAMPEESYLRHLAIRYADDPGPVIEQVREERTRV